MIFQDQARPVKFFIQKDLPDSVIDELTAQITTNGGSVEEKVPLQGFIVIEPTSDEGRRLYACWNTTNRPLRCFVPPPFVSGCLQAKKILSLPFRDREKVERKRVHIHPSITDETIAGELRACIWNAGGDPTATELEADVIIAEEEGPAFDELIRCYDHTRNKFIESPAWVKECVKSGTYRNTPSVKKNLGGRFKGSRRTEFSEADDRNLASYIASRLPDPIMRGRTGNKIYQDMCSRVDLYPWADRHPWQSWRERYKHNVPRFTRLIETYVKNNPAPADGKGLHGYVRASSSITKKKDPNSISPVTDSGKGQPKPPAVPDPSLDHEWGGSQWEVRVGNSSPPAWAKGKRKAEEDVQAKPVKRSKTSDDNKHEPARSLGAVAEESVSNPSSRPLHTAETGKLPTRPADTTTVRSVTRSCSPQAAAASPTALSETQPDSLSQTQPDSEDDCVGEATQKLLAANQEMLADAAGTRTSRSPSKSKGATQGFTSFSVPQAHKTSVVNGTPSAEDIAPKALDAGQVLVEIACKYRFVLDEVAEVYEEQKRDLEKTREFFKEVRKDLNEKRTTWSHIAGRVVLEPEEAE